MLLVFLADVERLGNVWYENQTIAMNTDSSVILLVEVFHSKIHVLVYFRQDFHPWKTVLYF